MADNGMEAPQSMSGRLRWVDVCKGIAIIAVILHHITFQGAKTDSLLYPYVNQFGVPLFFVVAGFFLSTKKPFMVFVKEKAFRLLTPFFLTCALLGIYVLVLKQYLGTTKPPTIWVSLREFIWGVAYGAGYPFDSLPKGVGYIGAIWFLEALFVALVEVRLVLARWEDRPLVGTCVVWTLTAVALIAAQKRYVPFNVEQGLVGGAFVYAGHLYKRYVGLKERCRPEILLILLFVFLCSAHLGIVISMCRALLPQGALSFAMSLCASLLVFEVSKIVDVHGQRLATFLAFLGQGSLAVLCVHLLLLNCGFRLLVVQVCSLFVASPGQNIVSLVNLVAQLAICTLAVLALGKTRYLRKVFT